MSAGAPAQAQARRAVLLGVLGALLLLTAVLFDAEPLYVPGLGFMLLAAVAIAWVHLGARGIVVERMIVASSVQEDEPLAVRITVRTTHAVLPAGTIQEPLLRNGAPLAAGRRHTSVHITARFARRGRRVLPAPAVTVRDPFGLASVTVGGRQDDEILVLPAITPVRVAESGTGADVLGNRAAPAGLAAEIELDGLRPLRPGAPASRISWAAWARTGELLERHLRPDTDSRPIIVLDPRTGPGAGPQDLDAAVRAAASLCVHLARRGGCSLLLPGDRRPVAVDPSLASWPRLHVRLAVLTDGSAPALQALTGRRGAVIYVSARPLVRAPRALEQAYGAGRILVLPGTFGHRAASFAVGGCAGYDLTTATATARPTVF